MAYAAMPARVTGSAAVEATFTEQRTGAVTSVSGPFSVNLPPGAYTVECGTMSRTLELLAGASYDLSLDPAHWVEIGPCTATATEGGRIRIEVKVRGAGKHELEVRVFNGTADEARTQVSLGEAGEQTVAWDLHVEREQTPWAAFIVPDGDVRGGREVYGPLGPAAGPADEADGGSRGSGEQ
jgi:hypothetical protein